jgi:hypothetical protein
MSIVFSTKLTYLANALKCKLAKKFELVGDARRIASWLTNPRGPSLVTERAPSVAAVTLSGPRDPLDFRSDFKLTSKEDYEDDTIVLP